MRSLPSTAAPISRLIPVFPNANRKPTPRPASACRDPRFFASYYSFAFKSTLAEAVTAVHDQVHLSDTKMYLFDIEQNPSESVEEGCGASKSLGPMESCANLYSIPAFREVRKKLEGMLLKADRESVAPTLRWEDDGPLADPANFGGWVPWRDRNGDALASYSGVAIGGEDDAAASRDAGSPAATGVSLAGVGWGGEQGGTVENAITVTATYASGLAMFIAIIAVGSTFVAYRAGQRSGYHVLS